MPLTVCCLADEPPAQVARILECFRAVADDVFVGVDSRVDSATCRKIAYPMNWTRSALRCLTASDSPF